MQKKHWLQTAVSLVLLGSLVLPAVAQDAVTPAAGVSSGASVKSSAVRGAYGTGRGYSGFQSRLDRMLGLSAEQREVLRGLLAQQHQDLKALREGMEPKYAAIQDQTDAKIRALLNPEQQKKFDSFRTQKKQARRNGKRRAS